ncbi:hypothetical protein SAMN02745116_01758 [Pilibacter termitis]|uniref:Replication terminator protein n=1 Tax=Pilibacter termitis TaxID=263852 RepID=A0A1T4PCJ2_9ENTE|nr:hypothetical protein [Pilibacter termitis]SJZ89295.1 hypothetical protein SAMN02745116_01758 [Pilibacter termitis]
MHDTNELNIAKLNDGIIQERFRYELDKVIENIKDPNVDSDKKRQIIITLDITPSNNFDSAINIEAVVKSKLLPEKTSKVVALYGEGMTGEMEVNELKTNQRGQMYFDEKAQLRTDTGQKIEEVETESKKVIKFNKKAGEM